MGERTKKFIKEHPFTVFFFIGGGTLGLLIASKLNLASNIYSAIKNPFGYDPTGMLMNFIFIMPITVLIDFLCTLIGGILFAIPGALFDFNSNKKKSELEKLLGKPKLDLGKNLDNKTEQELEQIEKERLSLKEERLKLEKERLCLEKEKQDL